MSRPAFLALGLLLFVGTAAGCGTSGDRDRARHATQTLYSAVQHRDGTAACAQMSASLRARLVSDKGQRCAKAVLRLELTGHASGSIKVYANEALVRMINGDTVFLSDTPKGWRVDALGCRPRGHRPYDCQATS
jgi:hypothetical protein